MIYTTTVPGFSLRAATEDDVPLVLQFIKALAAYEKMSDEVVATVDSVRRSVFEQGRAKVLIGELEGQPVAFALYFYNYSTFLGARVSIWRTCSCTPRTGVKGWAKRFLPPWPRSRWTRAAAAWSGCASTGTSPLSPFIGGWAQCRWTSGRPTG